jgi:hypothetical protein
MHACTAADWPASIPRLTCPRYRARIADTVMAFEFDGLTRGGESAESRLGALGRCARAGFARPPNGMFSGFMARPWLAGRCLTRRDATPALLDNLVRYLIRTGRPLLPPASLAIAHERRCRWTAHNLAALFGEAAGPLALRCLEAARSIPEVWSSEAVDYDPAPQRWTVLDNGTLQRNGTVGVPHGHTLIGHQPIIWDIAAILAEWRLAPSAAAYFIGQLERRLGASLPRPALSAFLLAYHAFKLGALTLVRDCAEAPRDRAAIDEALAYSRAEAGRALGGVLLPTNACD